MRSFQIIQEAGPVCSAISRPVGAEEQAAEEAGPTSHRQKSRIIEPSFDI